MIGDLNGYRFGPDNFKCARARCKTCPFICNVEKLSEPKRSIKITKYQRTVFIQLICSVVFHVTRHQLIAQLHLSVYKPHTTHNSSIRSEEGLRLETSAFESLYGGQFTVTVNSVDKTKFSFAQSVVRDAKENREKQNMATRKPGTRTTRASSPRISCGHFFLSAYLSSCSTE